MEEKYCIVITTCDNENIKDKIINNLLEKKLAACIQVSKVDSHYFWKGKIENTNEFLLNIKTKQDFYCDVEKCILENHSYETPEIILIPIEKGYNDYLKWIEENVNN